MRDEATAELRRALYAKVMNRDIILWRSKNKWNILRIEELRFDAFIYSGGTTP